MKQKRPPKSPSEIDKWKKCLINLVPNLTFHRKIVHFSLELKLIWRLICGRGVRYACMTIVFQDALPLWIGKAFFGILLASLLA
jgi:hypothetical protein